MSDFEAMGAAPRETSDTTADEAMPEELSPRHLRRRIAQLGLLAVAVVVVITVVPGLAQLRSRFADGRPEWIALAALAELASTLSYVAVFRGVFCPRMDWRTSYQIGMAEQAANSLLPAGGAGGLALGAWALRRSGTPTGHIARRTVAFFLITSAANFITLIAVGAALALGILAGRRVTDVTLSAIGAAALAILVVLSLPALTRNLGGAIAGSPTPASWLVRVIVTLGDGIAETVRLLRSRSPLIVGGSVGYMAFDIATLGVCFHAFGPTPPFGVLIVAYLLGQLGGLLPIPGGIGGLDGGLIGAFLIYGTPTTTAVAAVLAYRALVLWIPAVLGSLAFVRLRHVLRQEREPGVLCEPLAVDQTVVLGARATTSA